MLVRNLYDYTVMAYFDKSGEKWLKMGCKLLKIKEWEADFWNNNNEFPNDGSEKSNNNYDAFLLAKAFFEIKSKT